MFSFIIVLFFSVTGLTLNHVDWFPESTVVSELNGAVNAKWVSVSDTAKIPKLEIVEQLRANHSIKGQLNGYTADFFVNRADGSYEVTETKMGIIAVINDLHKGRDTGKAWSWVIDFSAIFMIVISVTGLILLLFLKKKRTNGLLWLAIGGVIAWAFYYFL
jgi:hypothetical protein